MIQWTECHASKDLRKFGHGDGDTDGKIMMCGVREVRGVRAAGPILRSKDFLNGTPCFK